MLQKFKISVQVPAQNQQNLYQNFIFGSMF